MRKIKGLFCILLGLAIWAFAITVLVAWIGFCFGTVIIGILLLIFVPHLLMAPLYLIHPPGTALLVHGMDCLVNSEKDSIYNREKE